MSILADTVSVRPLSSRPTHRRLPARWRGTLGVLGTGFVAAVAYVDPGNVAANLQAGSRFQYTLTWVLVLATLCAGVVQYLSAELGLITGKSLPELLGERLGSRSRSAFWLQAEGVAIATDLAEVVGGAVALQLLFGVPLLMGGFIAGAVSMGLLVLQDLRGQRQFERVVTGLLLIIAIGFVAGLFVAPPSASGIVHGMVPRFDGIASLMVATAMLGATVMPHAVYLHSALTRDRFPVVPPGRRQRQLLRGTRIDVIAAMVFAGAVNIAMMLMAASALKGKPGVETLSGAHAAVNSAMGPVVGVLFAVGLLVSGLASTSVGSYAGSVIMSGLLKKRVGLYTRRLITVAPALLVLASGVEPTTVLVVSQVVLSFGLPLAIVPLVRLTSGRTLMGEHVNSTVMKLIGWTIGVAIGLLNMTLIVGVLSGT